jgi:DNA-directed RNA polymerase specialized sigma24 family protein
VQQRRSQTSIPIRRERHFSLFFVFSLFEERSREKRTISAPGAIKSLDTNHQLAEIIREIITSTRVRKQIQRVCRRSRNLVDAEEIHSDIFLHAVTKVLPRKDPSSGTFRAYLAAAIQNRLRDLMRYWKRRQIRFVGFEEAEAEPGNATSWSHSRSEVPAPDERVLIRDLLESAKSSCRHQWQRDLLEELAAVEGLFGDCVDQSVLRRYAASPARNPFRQGCEIHRVSKKQAEKLRGQILPLLSSSR